MNKVNELAKLQKEEEKLLIAKMLDKLKFANSKNKFQHMEFLDLAQQAIIKKMIELKKANNCELFGGFEQAERKMLFIFPGQHIDNIKNLKSYKRGIYNDTISIVRIDLPKETYNKYAHRTYLGALMKIGIKREMVGDIIVRENGADILVSTDIGKYVENSIKQLTRFKKANIQILPIEELKYQEVRKEIIIINIPSMRLDCIVAELANCSRKKANSLIEQERVFVNFSEELSPNKKINENTYITIRGKGRFKILSIAGQTRKGRLTVEVEK